VDVDVNAEVEGCVCGGVVRDGFEELELLEESINDVMAADCDVPGVGAVNFESEILLDRYEASVADAEAEDAMDELAPGAMKCAGLADGGRFS
jgi:hypothetical protein